MKRSRLARGKPMSRGRSTLRRTRLAPVSDKRLDESEDRWRVRCAVFWRDGDRCRLDPTSRFYPHGAGSFTIPPCRGPLTFHHLLKASACGPYSEENGVALCAGHNSWVENEPDVGKALGLVIR